MQFYRISILAFLTVVTLSFWSVASRAADTSEKANEAYEIIQKFADKICDKIPLEHRGEKTVFTATGKAQVNGILKKVADLGFEGKAEHNQESSQGVLEKDLVVALQDSRACKERVFQTIWHDLMGDTKQPKEENERARIYRQLVGDLDNLEREMHVLASQDLSENRDWRSFAPTVRFCITSVEKAAEPVCKARGSVSGFGDTAIRRELDDLCKLVEVWAYEKNDPTFQVAAVITSQGMEKEGTVKKLREKLLPLR
ncbi:MAG: hypothetical protein ACLQVJ_13845 [Syntrophobacteraceae bacterium]